MAFVSDVIQRTTRVLPGTHHSHWLLRLPLAFVLLQYGFDKFPLSADVAAGWGLPLSLWAMAGVAEILAGAALIIGGALRTRMGDHVTRLAGAAAAVIVVGVLIVAYWAPPIDILLFNQFHILLICAGLYLALGAHERLRQEG
ncbi:MAG: hypothetical protein EA339_03775 [Rhodobacteraceae bacterium]|nr:MAG: hypothetical protein EA339_03775 [Paracoccaceae bacterium]